MSVLKLACNPSGRWSLQRKLLRREGEWIQQTTLSHWDDIRRTSSVEVEEQGRRSLFDQTPPPPEWIKSWGDGNDSAAFSHASSYRWNTHEAAAVNWLGHMAELRIPVPWLTAELAFVAKIARALIQPVNIWPSASFYPHCFHGDRFPANKQQHCCVFLPRWLQPKLTIKLGLKLESFGGTNSIAEALQIRRKQQSLPVERKNDSSPRKHSPFSLCAASEVKVEPFMNRLRTCWSHSVRGGNVVDLPNRNRPTV